MRQQEFDRAQSVLAPTGKGCVSLFCCQSHYQQQEKERWQDLVQLLSIHSYI